MDIKEELLNKQRERAIKRALYKATLLNSAKEQTPLNKDGTVNLEAFLANWFVKYAAVLDSIPKEERAAFIKQKCDAIKIDYEKVKLYMLFS